MSFEEDVLSTIRALKAQNTPEADAEAETLEAALDDLRNDNADRS